MAERDSERRRLAELVVHDLRNPLSALLGNLELLREELGEVTPAAKEGLDDCAALATRALSLVACILDVAELEAGDLRVEREPVPLGDLVVQAVARNASSVRVRSLSVELEIPDGMQASLDSDLFERVLEHLIDNAVRYARRGGRVVVACSQTATELEIAIGNDGPPVPASEREAIFGRHYRAEARRASAHRGLGLYFCRLAVEAHGGSIAVEERGPLGAVFVARIPR
jgi:K+-sensing histidine kinase KdpD